MIRWAQAYTNNRLHVLFGLLLVGLPFFALGVLVLKPEPTVCAFRLPADQCVKLEVADTDQARVQGLSGRQTLAENQGMLFVYDAPGNHCMWMKDMHLGIDIIWLNRDGKITDIKQNVDPNTYPESFCPSEPALHVIEVSAGVATKAGLKVGQIINL